MNTMSAMITTQYISETR